jgi:hypothetical protein
MNSKQLILSCGILSIVGIVLTAGIFQRNTKQLLVQQTARKEVVCPSFLSIARSARDTLIIMRNDTLCNRYVLDNLK